MDKEIAILNFIFVLVSLVIITQQVGPTSTTTLSVYPQLTTVEIFRIFQVNISISEVTDLAGWDFKLYYPNSLLNATEIIEGSFLKTAGDTFFTVKEFTDNYNETHGRIWVACVLQGQGSGANGTGTLATITFKAKLDGIATLHLAETDLIDSKMPPNHIPHTTTDGTVEILGHDIALELSVSNQTIIIKENLTIYVTCINLGDYTETFDVLVNYTRLHDPLIGIQTVTLAPGESVTLNFTWTTSISGQYKILAYTSEIFGDVYPNNSKETIVYVVLNSWGLSGGTEFLMNFLK